MCNDLKSFASTEIELTNRRSRRDKRLRAVAHLFLKPRSSVQNPNFLDPSTQIFSSTKAKGLRHNWRVSREGVSKYLGPISKAYENPLQQFHFCIKYQSEKSSQLERSTQHPLLKLNNFLNLRIFQIFSQPPSVTVPNVLEPKLNDSSSEISIKKICVRPEDQAPCSGRGQ